jgi:hypothetical protein
MNKDRYTGRIQIKEEKPMVQLVDNKFVSLREIGKDETWLQKWIIENPSRLGLGPLKIITQELRQYGRMGGRLDILAYRADLDTYYEIEVMLGECDSDHGFRALDYWARERLRRPNARHVAVIVAEDLSGRYRTIIETLPQFLPLIAVELKTILLGEDCGLATTLATIVAQPDDLIVGTPDEPIGTREGMTPRDEEWWLNEYGASFVQAVKQIATLCSEKAGPSRIDFTAQSYISLKKGRRCWLPMWPRKDGLYVYVPGGPGGAEDQPSDFYARIKEALEPLGIEPGWTYKYNNGANPISFAIPSQYVGNSTITEMLVEAYEYA